MNQSEAKKQERTPGPWQFRKGPMGIGIWPHDEDGIIAEVERLKDAAHIVHCVNTYDELVGALEAIEIVAFDVISDNADGTQAAMAIKDMARAALKRAKGNGE